MNTVKARYICLVCDRTFRGHSAIWKLPESAVMTMDEDELRRKLTGPYCPRCGSDFIREVPHNETA